MRLSDYLQKLKNIASLPPPLLTRKQQLLSSSSNLPVMVFLHNLSYPHQTLKTTCLLKPYSRPSYSKFQATLLLFTANHWPFDLKCFPLRSLPSKKICVVLAQSNMSQERTGSILAYWKGYCFSFFFLIYHNR